MFLFEATDTNEKESQKGRRSTEAIRLFFSSPAYEGEQSDALSGPTN